MEPLQYDSYTSYSDASTPRTPSPRTSIGSDELQYHASPAYKPSMDLPALTRNIFSENPGDEGGIVPEHGWHAPYPSHYAHVQSASRGSLLEELYDHEIPEHGIVQDVYVDGHHPHHHDMQGNGWNGGIPQTAHGEHHLTHSARHVHDVAMTRRATFPYVRQDRGDAMSYSPAPHFLGDHDSLSGSPYSSRPSTMYSEPLSLDSQSPHAMCEPLQGHIYDEPFAHTVPMTNSPHPPYHDFRHMDGIKTEDTVPHIVPSQNQFGRPPSAGMHPLPCLSPHAGILVQHTDDAASKETQYLRRRCFNCHTTEPPSWRRSTLNPGKIVCNKCGLYERTHLRPRPLRFDELRAGSKTRKQPKVGGSPKGGKMLSMVKKEPRESEVDGIMPRRSSVSSSSASSVSGTSDWDDSVSVYSSGSAPPSSFNSPSVQTFPIPRDPNSQSPPLPPQDGGIRLPNAPLSDIASLQSEQSPNASPATPRKSATAPYFPQNQSQPDFFPRRGSLPVQAELQRRHTTSLDMPIPEVTGWQSVPLPDISSAKAAKPRSDSLRKAVVV